MKMSGKGLFYCMFLALNVPLVTEALRLFFFEDFFVGGVASDKGITVEQLSLVSSPVGGKKERLILGNKYD